MAKQDGFPGQDLGKRSHYIRLALFAQWLRHIGPI
jgi:hypothetical protein